MQQASVAVIIRIDLIWINQCRYIDPRIQCSAYGDLVVSASIVLDDVLTRLHRGDGIPTRHPAALFCFQ